MPFSTEKNILNLFQRLAESDDQQALWELHEHYYPRIYRFIFSLVSVKEVAEEIASDTFIGIWQKRALLINVSKPEVYLFICAKNRALKQLKRRTIFTESIREIDDTDCVLERNPHDMLVSSEMLLRINKAIQALPPKCKLIFTLVKENNLKYREVADLLDISEKTVEAQMSIALKKLSASIPFSFIS